jgi:hypothetical protein
LAEGERKRGVRALGLHCRSWASGWLGPGREGEGAREGEKGTELLGWAGCSFPSLFFLFSTLKLFKQLYLNSNKFEFRHYKLNTNKTMPQHECTNKLIL